MSEIFDTKSVLEPKKAELIAAFARSKESALSKWMMSSKLDRVLFDKRNISLMGIEIFSKKPKAVKKASNSKFLNSVIIRTMLRPFGDTITPKIKHLSIVTK